MTTKRETTEKVIENFFFNAKYLFRIFFKAIHTCYCDVTKEYLARHKAKQSAH